MEIAFTAHNIRLDDGSLTKPDASFEMSADPRLLSALRVLNLAFHGDKSKFRIADIGCLEGGYAVEFARAGFEVVGLEVRDSNIAACNYVKERVNLPNLSFVQDDAWNIAHHGPFDAVFCCGLLYHLDRPKAFLELLSSVTRRVLILQTHFALADRPPNIRRLVPQALARRITFRPTTRYNLSETGENEGLPGRWYSEFDPGIADSEREAAKWASWSNHRSFWIQREYLLQAISDVGFDLVVEQFDNFAPKIAHELTAGFYREHDRGTFAGIKTQAAE